MPQPHSIHEQLPASGLFTDAGGHQWRITNAQQLSSVSHPCKLLTTEQGHQAIVDSTCTGVARSIEMAPVDPSSSATFIGTIQVHADTLTKYNCVDYTDYNSFGINYYAWLCSTVAYNYSYAWTVNQNGDCWGYTPGWSCQHPVQRGSYWCPWWQCQPDGYNVDWENPVAVFSLCVPGTGFCGNVERDYLYLRLNTTMYGFQYKVVYGPYRTAG